MAQHEALAFTALGMSGIDLNVTRALARGMLQDTDGSGSRKRPVFLPTAYAKPAGTRYRADSGFRLRLQVEGLPNDVFLVFVVDKALQHDSLCHHRSGAVPGGHAMLSRGPVLQQLVNLEDVLCRFLRARATREREHMSRAQDS